MAVELGSLTAAARAVGVSPAVASAGIKRLEQALDARLLLRSTRSLRLTPEGERYLAHAREALRCLDEGEQALRGEGERLRGELRVSAPSDLGRHTLLEWLGTFQQMHPELRLKLQLTDRLADVYRQPVEVALRYGQPPDASLVALPLAPANRRVLCASDAYLARAGVPQTPMELARHNCLCFMVGDDIHRRWPFTGPDGSQVDVDVTGDRSSNDGEVVRRWAVAGLGIVCKSWMDVADDVAAGRLRVLCPDWTGEATPLYLISPDRRLISPAVQRLRAFLTECCAALAPPPGAPTPAGQTALGVSRAERS